MSGRPQLTDDPQALRVLAEIGKVCGELTKAEAKVTASSRTRNALFLKARGLGVTQRQIADTAQISEPAVAKAMKKAEAEQP